MHAAKWLAGFRSLHERARRGPLSDEEQHRYLSMRDELARSLVQAQGLGREASQQARRSFRVAQVFPVEFSRLPKTVTVELSRGGFSVLVDGAPRVGDVQDFKLTPARGVVLQGRARVAAVNGPRVSFAIEHLGEEDTERLEVALFDAVLARLA